MSTTEVSLEGMENIALDDEEEEEESEEETDEEEKKAYDPENP